jgi:hypothetical protein
MPSIPSTTTAFKLTTSPFERLPLPAVSAARHLLAALELRMAACAAIFGVRCDAIR